MGAGVFGKRGGGSREKRKREESKGSKPPLSLLVLVHFLHSTLLSKNRLVLVLAGKNRQIQEHLCPQKMW